MSRFPVNEMAVTELGNGAQTTSRLALPREWCCVDCQYRQICNQVKCHEDLETAMKNPELPEVLAEILQSGKPSKIESVDLDYAFFIAWSWHLKTYGMVTPEIVCEYEDAYPLYQSWSAGEIDYPDDFQSTWWEFYWWPAGGEVAVLRELLERYSSGPRLYSTEIDINPENESFCLKVYPDLHVDVFDSADVRDAVLASIQNSKSEVANELAEIVTELITNEQYLRLNSA